MYKISELEQNDFLNEDNCYGIINIYNDNLSEMARAGKIPNTQLEIHIEGGEGYIPHMHICKKNGKDIILRICLLTNEYFREKDDKMNTLNTIERKELNNYLKKKILYRETTNWDYIVDTWNRYNSSHAINPDDVKQPDYTTIHEPKKGKKNNE